MYHYHMTNSEKMIERAAKAEAAKKIAHENLVSNPSAATRLAFREACHELRVATAFLDSVVR